MAVTTKSLLVLRVPRRMRVFRRRHGVFVPDLAVPAVNHDLAAASLPQVPLRRLLGVCLRSVVRDRLPTRLQVPPIPVLARNYITSIRSGMVGHWGGW